MTETENGNKKKKMKNSTQYAVMKIMHSMSLLSLHMWNRKLRLISKLFN